MKQRAMRAERKFFPTFDFKLSASTAVKFIAEALLLFLVASVPDFGFALALALFCGLVYAKQNVIALAPVFIVACCVFMLSWWTLLYAAVPVLTLVALYAVFSRLKRNVPLWAAALTAAFGMIPYAVCTCVFSGAYFLVAVNVFLAVVLSFCCGITAYAIFVRGYVHSVTVDELICSGILLVVFGYALAGVKVYGLCLLYTVAAFILLFSSASLKVQTTLFIAILLGLGGALAEKDLAYLGIIAILGTAAVAFSPFTRWSSALAIIAFSGLMWLFGAYSDAGWQTFTMTAVGVVLCVMIPRSVFMRVKGLSRGDNSRVYTGLVNRRGRELAARLYSTGDVFYEMSKNLDKLANGEESYNAERLSREIAANYCGKCSDREACFSALGESTACVIRPVADAALNRGQGTILDVPTFLSSRCSKMHSLLAVVNSSADSYRRKIEQNKSAAQSKAMMSEQFAGIALVLDSLADMSSEQVRFVGDDVEYIKSELLKHNVVASELVITGGGEKTSVAALVRACDAQKAIIPRVLSKLLKVKLQVDKIEDRGENKLVYLVNVPVFEVAYGIAEKARDNEGVSGDSRSILCPSRTERLFAICDGMGSGGGASEASRDAVNMIESFYRAGFDNALILSLVNKLLKLSLNEAFSSLDIAVIDTVSGGLDVIKLGAAGSFIVRKDNVEMLSCTLPPAGIIESVQPMTSRYQLFDGDMLVMMSDGVFDALESRGVTQIIDELDTVNPQTLADGLLSGALKNGAEDDCTVMVMRIFCV